MRTETDPTNFIDPAPWEKELKPLDDEAILKKVAKIEEQLHDLRNDAYGLALENEVLKTQNKVLHDAHEEDRRTIVRLLREIEALKTEQPEDGCE